MDAAQRTDEWFAARLGKATASMFNDIIAQTRSGYASSRANYRAQLAIERVSGQKADSYTNSFMQWGIDNEPTARMAYESETGREVNEAQFVEHDLLAAGASPDGYVGDDGLIEIKCPNSATHIETLIKRAIPKQYIAQVQGQMWITGRKWCDFVSFDPRLPANAQLFIVRVERDDEFISILEQEVIDFLSEVDDTVEFIKTFK